MKKFLDENFLLQSKTAEILYHDHAKELPIIDYHCHLPPDDIASNKMFENLTKIWLDGDHYKWRALRANGVDEKFITGEASDLEKFIKWAETVPYTLRNPLYVWTHLELKRYFGIEKSLNTSSAIEIYSKATELLQTDEFRVQKLIKNKRVELICTTDDPIDSLHSHIEIRKQNFPVRILPTWRPDRAIGIENPPEYNSYIDKLAEVSGIAISNFQNLLDALYKRQEFFHSMGCKLSDHGLETFYSEDYTETELKTIFSKVRSGKYLHESEILKFKSAMLIHFAEMDYEFNWTQQFHLGSIRNNNKKMFAQLGPDKGYDSISDLQIARGMSKFLDTLEQRSKLTRTIVYNLNPKDNEMIVAMVGNFNDGITPGKMQFGSGWWYLDQKDGMIKQLNALSNLGLLRRFVGMLTDSRSFLSYPRHEYFRRILCNLIATDVENGELPADMELLGKMVGEICYYNAKDYFKFS